MIKTGTQLYFVFRLIRDGQWRSPAEVGDILSISSRSAASRMRDLRLSRYGSHCIESRRRERSPQIWEYRMLDREDSALAGTSENSESSISSTIEFINVHTLKIEKVPTTRCRMDTSLGIGRIIAVDQYGRPLLDLVTMEQHWEV